MTTSRIAYDNDWNPSPEFEAWLASFDEVTEIGRWGLDHDDVVALFEAGETPLSAAALLAPDPFTDEEETLDQLPLDERIRNGL